MNTKRLKMRDHVSVLVLVIAALFSGCATPSDIKRAARAQVELIGALDDATSALQAGLGQFHQDQEARIREEGRVLIARQAIAVAVTDTNETSTADGLFDTSDKQVRPWVDYAFAEPEIDAAIQETQKRLQGATNELWRASLTFDLNKLKARKGILSKKPEGVRELEGAILNEITQEREIIGDLADRFRLLHAQVALMKGMASTIDDWLTIDITITKEQAEALEKSFLDAQAAWSAKTTSGGAE